MTYLRVLTTVCLTLPWTIDSKKSNSASSNSNVPSSITNSALTANSPSDLQAVQASVTLASDPSSSTTSTSSSQPLRTLKKLQAMLDETDYVTESTNLTRLPTVEDDHNFLDGKDGVSIQQRLSQQEDHRIDPVSIGEEENSSSKVLPSLWTSKDRSKYKRQQQLQSVKRIALPDTENGTSSGAEDLTDDGLEYTLPSLPIYVSDGEISTEDDSQDEERDDRLQRIGRTNQSINSTLSNTKTQEQLNLGTVSETSFHDSPAPSQPSHASSHQSTIDSTSQQKHNTSPQLPPYLPNPWNYYYPPMYSTINSPPYLGPAPIPPYQTIPLQTPSSSQSSWTTAYPPNYYGNPYSQPAPNYPHYLPPQNLQPYPSNHQRHEQQFQSRYPADDVYFANSHPSNPAHHPKSLVAHSMPLKQQSIHSQTPYFIPNPPKYSDLMVPSTSSLTNPSNVPKVNTAVVSSLDLSSIPSSPSPVSSSIESSLSSSLSSQGLRMQSPSTITLDSVQKILIVFGTVAVLCYCAVSPRTLDTLSYNKEFQKNLQRLGFAWVPPFLFILIGIVDRKENNINSMVGVFLHFLILIFIVQHTVFQL